MSQDSDRREELTDDQLAALGVLLGSAAVWDDPQPALEESVVASTTDEARLIPRFPPAPGKEDRRHLRIIAIAAALLLITGVSIGLLATREKVGDVVALSGTDLASDAEATAELIETPQGLLVLMSITGLAPAEPGTYYQGWIRNGSDGVSIGTFHMRGGDGEVELWAGVLPEDYPIVAVTIQQEGGGPQSSGQLVLQGQSGG